MDHETRASIATIIVVEDDNRNDIGIYDANMGSIRRLPTFFPSDIADISFAFALAPGTLIIMPEFDVDAFIAELERLGLKLTATRLLDGTYRVNRWRMPDAITHAQQIEDFWAKHIGDDKARMIILGTHLARRLPNRSK